MRISDWSSDVCSSDLLARMRDLIGFEYDGATAEVTIRRQESPPRFTQVRYAVLVASNEPTRRADLVHQNLRKFGTVYNTLAAEIGRASCRERVCQYV